MKYFRLSWWCTPIISFFWVRARDLSIQAKYQACLSKLARIKWMRGPDISPMGQWSAEYYILEGHSYYGLEQNNKAQTSLNQAVKILQGRTIYSDWEKDYLLAFIETAHPGLDFPADVKIDMNHIDLEYITNDMKNSFPLANHPNWIH